MFPTMENQELYKCLERADINLEQAIKQLEDLSLGTQDLPRQYATALVSRFENASKEEAVEIATDAFYQFSQEIRKKDSREAGTEVSAHRDAEKLMQDIRKLAIDNTTLKRAVIKLKERTDKAEEVEAQNLILKNEVQQLSLANYMLRIHLQNAMEGGNRIEKEKDIF